jgi:hypothetical protein
MAGSTHIGSDFKLSPTSIDFESPECARRQRHYNLRSSNKAGRRDDLAQPVLNAKNLKQIQDAFQSKEPVQ